MDKVIELVKRDPIRLKALDVVAQLALPQCYIAAGFVRNLIWDSLHDFSEFTPLNDVDVVYFDADEVDSNRYLEYEKQLSNCMPELNWQVRNQARMHIKNQDEPYTSTLHAMSYWPEKETAVAITQVTKHQYECIAAFGFESLFRGQLTYNPKRKRAVFDTRVRSKGWLVHWPKLNVM
ncbi:nucleotidyltransferase family protein [Pseudoalteromonas luteoviolacea]|uniref:Nitrate reductase n=1 Tax=Pseudoalteromonas luteoviolacea H33 TaxID=1365251 RepID=A0A167DDK8_9GAMM|nr:nucleotidyltransferase family protein [Pseudoalteromonas luteoviolacea]KZN48704.1 hypothetical protein N476_21050 [Pseudoalteromonas luteoviolacea H33]KZN75461.1 hypothetical protein N477_01735 [Pseudoalteromonas luteoviolacea H33-S]MBQ4878660.1 nucleotidyltransferase family protein [Pseudoalteromonas luteoviolacea]MBQ4907200.1 nucleotidyltransferase family protein [Pseudoalteromonas luteoviolacea]